MWVAVGAAGAWVAYQCGHFLLAAPEMTLVHPDQISVAGNRYVSPARVREVFAADRNRSVLLIPLDARRQALEAIPWVEQASVRRALPNKIQVDITERTPIAFLREGSDLALIDEHGVILDRPVEGAFHFPVLTGLGSDMALDDREKRMQLFAGFMQSIELARSGASEQVSEVDLAEVHDVRATLTGFGSAAAAGGSAAPLVVHFGEDDFQGKYQTLVEGIAEWRATAGTIESVDLRYSREAVVNQERTAPPRRRPPGRAAVHGAKHSRSIVKP